MSKVVPVVSRGADRNTRKMTIVANVNKGRCVVPGEHVAGETRPVWRRQRGVAAERRDAGQGAVQGAESEPQV